MDSDLITPAPHVDRSLLCRDLFDLLAVTHFLPGVIDKIGDHPEVNTTRGDPIESLITKFIDVIPKDLLISVAVRVRAISEETFRHYDHNHPQVQSKVVRRGHSVLGEMQVGVWVTDASGEKHEQSSLSLHDACDKLIHAQKITQKEISEIGMQSFRVVGERYKKSWEVEIDITKYVRASIFLAYGGIDFNRSWIGER